MSDPGLLAAFAAGFLTFVSPCVLPLIPGYLSFISGYSLAEIRSGASRYRVVAKTAVFAAGFSAVFVVLGLVFSGGGLALGGLSRGLTIAAGALIALLGLNLVFDFIKVLNLEARFRAREQPAGYAGSFLVGVAFAAGWSPCVGPILASILLFASREGALARSAVLLGAYSLGLALPFLAVALFFDRVRPLMDWFKRHARAVRITSGIFLVTLGAAMALGKMGVLSGLAPRWGMALREGLVANPESVRTLAAMAWLAIGGIIALVAVLRRRSLLAPGRVLALAILACLAALELTGLWSFVDLLAEWLLFQGA